MPDHWTTLGLEPGANAQEINRKFHALSRKWHPDKNRSPEATERMQALIEARDALLPRGLAEEKEEVSTSSAESDEEVAYAEQQAQVATVARS